jgi:hypothetical protein
VKKVTFYLVLSRDLDSPLTLRERSAVDAWLLSNKSFHAMRDHPLHETIVLAGMWGFRPSLNRKLSRTIHHKLHNTTLVKAYTGLGDQPFLAQEVWPYVTNDRLVHDSFHCEKFGEAVPFPTQRPPLNETYRFVGCIKPCTQAAHTFNKCPIACRPKDHKDWVDC